MVSNLLFIASEKARQPFTRLLRVSIASPMGFAALAPAVADLHFLGNPIDATARQRLTASVPRAASSAASPADVSIVTAFRRGAW